MNLFHRLRNRQQRLSKQDLHELAAEATRAALADGKSPAEIVRGYEGEERQIVESAVAETMRAARLQSFHSMKLALKCSSPKAANDNWRRMP